MNVKIRQSFLDSRVLSLKTWLALLMFAAVFVPFSEWAVTGWLKVRENMIEITDLIEYKKVVPTKPRFTSCEDVEILSYKRSDVESMREFVSILLCDKNDGAGFGSVDVDLWPPALRGPFDYWDNPKKWTYSGKRSDVAATCYIQSTYCDIMKYTPPKCARIDSGKFFDEGSGGRCE